MTAVAEKPGKASRLYCESFTKEYGEISAASPVYAQLRCMIDLSIAAAFLRNTILHQSRLEGRDPAR